MMRYGDKVLYLAYSCLRDKDWAEDVAQEVFLQVKIYQMYAVRKKGILRLFFEYKFKFLLAAFLMPETVTNC
ncbi:MAG: hypothetical protein K6U04_03345 [Armatimonadetes bacterium]|nr:hypothetical protein [Armatimonadota bacterium]